MQNLRELHRLEFDVLRAVMAEGQANPSSAVAMLDDLGVTNEDFSDSAKGALFDAVMAQLRNGLHPEVHSLMKATKGRCNGDLVVKAFMESEGGVLQQRISVLSELAAQRRLIAALNSALSMAKVNADVGAVVTEAIQALSSFKTPTIGPRSAESETLAIIEEVEAVYNGLREPVLESGIPSLDALIGGLPPTLTVIGALPGVGKSALLARIVSNITSKGKRVGVFSLEDQGRWLNRRLIAEQSGVPVGILANKKVTPNQLERFGDACGSTHNAVKNIILDDRKGMTTKDIVTAARVMMTRYGVKALFLDHLGEIHVERSDRYDLDLSECIRDLRALADVYRVPMVLFCHLRRRQGLERTDTPELTDFANTSGLERMARLAIGLSQRYDADGRPTALGVHVLKQTQGIPNVSTWLKFNGPAAMVTNLEAMHDDAREH